VVAQLHQAVVIPRESGVSSTPQLLGLTTNVSGILDHPPSRVMTTLGGYSSRRAHSFGVLLHRLIRQPLELERERVNERHLALRHHDAGHVALGRYPPLGAGHAAPIELARGIGMIERRGLLDHAACKSVHLAGLW